jgi:hypothetical protein
MDEIWIGSRLVVRREQNFEGNQCNQRKFLGVFWFSLEGMPVFLSGEQQQVLAM